MREVFVRLLLCLGERVALADDGEISYHALGVRGYHDFVHWFQSNPGYFAEAVLFFDDGFHGCRPSGSMVRFRV
jgi:hypothetical protein